MKKFVYLPRETFLKMLEHVPEELRSTVMQEHQVVIRRVRGSEPKIKETTAPTPQTKMHQTVYKPGGGTKRDSGTLGRSLHARLDGNSDRPL